MLCRVSTHVLGPMYTLFPMLGPILENSQVAMYNVRVESPSTVKTYRLPAHNLCLSSVCCWRRTQIVVKVVGRYQTIEGQNIVNRGVLVDLVY